MTGFAELPHELSLEVGATEQLRLPTYSGSGNLWTVRNVDGANVAEVRVESRPPIAADERPPGGPPPGQSLATEFAVVTGVSSGVAHWRLVLARPWQPDNPTASHELTIKVGPARP